MSKSGLSSLLVNHTLLIFKHSLHEAGGRNIRPNIHFIEGKIVQTAGVEFFFIAKENNKLHFHYKNGVELDHFYGPVFGVIMHSNKINVP